MPILVCGICGTKFYRKPCELRQVNFCSCRCKNTGMFSGENNSMWKGGAYIQSGYRFVRLGKDCYRQEHRIVAEKMIGRPLKRTEVVHHANHNKLDNRPDNLVVMSNNGRHMKMHGPSRGFSVWDWKSRGSGCLTCGTKTRPHYAKGLCLPCYCRQRRPK